MLQVQKIVNQIISNLAQNQQMQEYCLVVTPEFSADADAQEFICKLVLQEGYVEEVFEQQLVDSYSEWRSQMGEQELSQFQLRKSLQKLLSSSLRIVIIADS